MQDENMNRIKIPIILFVAGNIALCAFFFMFYHSFYEAHALTTAEMTTKSKTLAFHILQSQSIVTSGSSVSGDVTVFIGEQNPVIKNAEIEIEGVTNAVSSQVITVDIKQSNDAFPTPRAQTFSLNSSGANNHILLRYNGVESGGNDLTAYLAGIITTPSPYTFTVKIDVNGANISLLKAKLILTYQFTPPSSGTTVPNSTTGVYKAFQRTGVLLDGASVTDDISVFVGDPNPVIKNAYLVVRGVSKSSASQTITIDIKQPGDLFPTLRSQSFLINTSGKHNFFSLLYAGSDGNDLTGYLAGIITDPTEYTFNIKISANGADVSLIQAWLVIVYQFSQTSSGFPATGTIVSSTFDTNAGNGATYNSILWKGILPPGTKIRFQLATATLPTGPFNFIGGATCASSDYFEPTASDQAIDIKCFSALNNKQYFRYKAILCSSSNCTSSGLQTPQVDDIIINWSP